MGLERAEAATSDTLNFQGRLLTSSGALVTDGSYNIVFTIYDDASAGTNQWGETQSVSVQNGYFSVYLGDVTPFGPSVPWDQELWLTMNVEGDGDMTPRFKLTAVPYAFRAGALVDSSGTAKTADNFAQLAPSSVQTINAALAALRLNQTGSGALLQLQGNGSDVFTLDKIGNAVLGAGLTVGNSTATTAGTIRWTGSDLEVYDGASWTSLTSGGGGGGSLAANSFYAYDAVGDINIAGGWTDITLDTEVIEDAPYTHAADGATVTIGEAGWYEISYNLSAYTTSGGNNQVSVAAKLLENTGGGFTDIPGSFGYSAVTSGPSDGNVAVTISRQFAAGDIVKLQAQRANGTITMLTRPNSAGLTIRKFVEDTGGGSGNSFEQGGNDFGATAILGTSSGSGDGLSIITDGNAALSFTNGGAATFSQNVTLSTGSLTLTAGDLNLNGNDLLNGGALSATSFTGNGSGLTTLNASNISSGTIGDSRLSTNVALLNGNQTFSGTPTFNGGVVLGNSTSTTAGALRWTGSDFEGYDGLQWLSLTSGGGGGGGGGSSSPAHTTVTKPSSENLMNSTTLQNDNHLFFNIGANETWSYRFLLQATTPVAAGIKFAVTAPSGSTCQVSFIDEQTASSQSNVSCGVASATLVGTGTNEVYEVTGAVTAGATAGQITLQWAQGSADLGNTTVLAGSYVVASVDGGGMVFLQGGNDFGSTAILGTSTGSGDGLTLITDGTAALSFSAGGLASFAQDAIFSGIITRGTLVTSDSAAQVAVSSGATTNKGLVIQGVASQSANLLEIQNSSGSFLSGFNASGGLVLGLSTITSTATNARTIQFPDASGTVCLSGSAACNFLTLAPASFSTDATTNNSIAINKTGASGNLLALQKNGANVFVVDNSGALQIQNTSSAALDVRNASGTSFFTVDTSAGSVRVGPTTADATGVLFVLDTKNTAGDPSGTNGGIYYNSNLGKFRCFEAGIWKDCIGTKQIRSFVDTVVDTVATTNTVNYWDTGSENNNTHPNITPTTTSRTVFGSISVQISSTTTQDRSVVTRVERGIGSVPTCGSGTTVGFYASTFTTNSGEIVTATVTFLDAPNTTSQVFYTVCSDANTASGAGVQVDRIRVTLEEATNSN